MKELEPISCCQPNLKQIKYIRNKKWFKHIIVNQVFVQHFGRIASDRQRLDSIRQTRLAHSVA